MLISSSKECIDAYDEIPEDGYYTFLSKVGGFESFKDRLYEKGLNEKYPKLVRNIERYASILDEMGKLVRKVENGESQVALPEIEHAYHTELSELKSLIVNEMITVTELKK